mmetsp:Transcript_24921/g.41545  ORF Transcript_24921/g.41545 Transcript_24921/m.41545 type:complete len:212 (+) Transcript_24921:87-722(+)
MWRSASKVPTLRVFAIVPLALLSSITIPANQQSTSSTGTDPLSCAVPACADKMDMFKRATKSERKSGANSTNRQQQQQLPAKYRNGCPVDRSELGASSWDLLHSIAAYYPEKPSEDDKRRVLALLDALAYLYPCPVCAKDFQATMSTLPPKVDSRKDLVLWMCEQHNLVNKKLHKPIFPCDMRLLDERWRLGAQECWEGEKLDDEDASGQE